MRAAGGRRGGREEGSWERGKVKRWGVCILQAIKNWRREGTRWGRSGNEAPYLMQCGVVVFESFCGCVSESQGLGSE